MPISVGTELRFEVFPVPVQQLAERESVGRIRGLQSLALKLSLAAQLSKQRLRLEFGRAYRPPLPPASARVLPLHNPLAIALEDPGHGSTAFPLPSLRRIRSWEKPCGPQVFGTDFCHQ